MFQGFPQSRSLLGLEVSNEGLILNSVEEDSWASNNLLGTNYFCITLTYFASTVRFKKVYNNSCVKCFDFLLHYCFFLREALELNRKL